MDDAKKYCLGSGVAPQTPIPLHIMGRKRCFWIPGMGVFEMDDAKKYCLGSGVAPLKPIPLHTMGQKKCFGIPGMEVFEMDNDNEFCLGFWGGAPNTHTAAHHGPKKVFLDTRDGSV